MGPILDLGEKRHQITYRKCKPLAPLAHEMNYNLLERWAERAKRGMFLEGKKRNGMK
jgi:hypothetical protein